ncbi:pentatricopeptide repeat-containing protein At4g19191, mitochondrial isoform X3 [Rosa chinensis]|uniref:pentatricopeptide repeat-containing protein At4g19191, mitochondrial isoform X3 n=1 Tax=Rosa chinensis TaxID=74649 RepID=UPI000D08C7B2|nr:pentatricopeptide repeat-containing protein At4g19191, mitochondrial isoform X3 [Rosa chinensis]
MVRFPKLSTAAAWNSIIRESVNQSHPQKVLLLFRQMKQNGLEPNNFTFPFLAKACAKLSNLKLSQTIHTHVVKSPFQSDIFVQTAILDMYVKCNQLGDAYNLFEKITMKDTASYNVMLMGFVQSGFLDKVLCLVHDMRFAGIQPDTITVMGLIQASLATKNLELVKSIHAFGIQIGIECDVSMANTWISAYSKCADLESAKSVFDRIDMGVRTVVSWNSMIAGYSNSNKFLDVLNVYKQMLSDGYRPDISTTLSVLSSCNEPNKLVQGCGHTGALDHGKWIHNYAFSNGLRDNTVVCNALIDMYAKCGNINNARELFYTLPVTTVVSWTSMIAGYALNGQYKEALDLFYLMLETGMKPNRLTFLAILQACTHAGLLEKGMEFFNKMTEVYYMNPGVDHYSCMVNLLGRKGKLEEAVELVKSMPMKPDAGIWGALLSACRIHHNMEIGEYAFSRLLELEPQVAVPYVEMANIYASQRRWDEVAALRTVMKFNKVKKFPGQSLVHVNGNPHVFTVEDSGHPEALFIHAMIGTLDLQLKEEHTTLKEVGDMIN